MSPERLERYHRYTRRHGVNWPLYLLARVFMKPFFLLYFRYDRTGREHGRVKGGLIVASNHRSFLDPFVIGGTLPWRRPMNYVAKVELFERRWQGWVLSRLGAFPIRRGESDEESMETARLVVERGGTVCIFPEGTRIRRGRSAPAEARRRPAGAADRGAGDPGRRARHRRRPPRLADPAAQGQGPARPGDDLPRAEAPSPALAETVTGADLAQRRAAVGGPRRPAADAPRRRDRRRQLGHRGRRAARPRRPRGPARHPHAERVAELVEAGENRRYLPGVPLPESLEVRQAGKIELAGLDLICLAIPSSSLPQAVGSIADRVGDRSSVLLLTKGLIAPQGQLPAEYVGERVRARGDRLPRRPGPRPRGGLRLRRPRARLRRRRPAQPARRGLRPRRPRLRALGDVTGVEMAGAAKNAAALAAAAAEPHGLNAAGIAAAEVWRECIDYAIERGAELETFSGLAGVGDLTATMMAPTGRNRRAGELLGTGTPAAEIPQLIGQASEGLDAVPLLAEAVSAAGCPAEALRGLTELIEGEVDAEAWIAGLRRTERARRAA